MQEESIYAKCVRVDTKVQDQDNMSSGYDVREFKALNTNQLKGKVPGTFSLKPFVMRHFARFGVSEHDNCKDTY